MTCIYNKTFVSIKKHEEKEKKRLTYGPNDARLATFGPCLVSSPCCYLPPLLLIPSIRCLVLWWPTAVVVVVARPVMVLL